MDIKKEIMSFSDYTAIIKKCFTDNDLKRLESILKISSSRLVNEIEENLNQQLDNDEKVKENNPLLLNQWEEVKGIENGYLVK